jgi:hypothetical protein
MPEIRMLLDRLGSLIVEDDELADRIKRELGVTITYDHAHRPTKNVGRAGRASEQ